RRPQYTVAINPALRDQGKHGLVARPGSANRASGQPGIKAVRRQRAGDQVTLRDIAAHLDQLIPGGVLLYPLGDNAQPEGVTEIDDSADHGEVAEVAGQSEYETLVDLHLVHRKTAQ